MKRSVLVVAAHPDDELLGVGGTLLRHVREGDSVSILILGDGETSRDEGVDVKKRESQANRVARDLKAKSISLGAFPDNSFDTVSLLSITKVVEAEVRKVKPQVVYTHHRHDLNVDHRRTFEAVLTACRPQPGFPVEKILTFETLSSSEWQVKSGDRMFCPTEYVDISGFLDRKIRLLGHYRDEMRPAPHPRSFEGVKALAKFRGIEVGMAAAEAFEVIRSLRR